MKIIDKRKKGCAKKRLGLQQVLVVIDLHDGEQEGTDEVLRVLPFGVENLGAVPDEESLQTQQAPEAGRGLQAQHLYRFMVTLGVGVDAVQQAGPCLEVLHHQRLYLTEMGQRPAYDV